MNASMSARFIGVKHITKFKTRNMGGTQTYSVSFVLLLETVIDHSEGS